MAKPPVGRIILVAILLVVGLGLYFWLAGRTPVVVHPAEIGAVAPDPSTMFAG